MIYNCDCIEGAKKYLKDESVSLAIMDPPFGIKETGFHKHYNRNEDNVLDGYTEAPDDYFKFSVEWLTQAKRVMKPDASMYVFSGWSNLRHLLNAVEQVGFFTINHLIWKYNFGVYTSKKFVSSHYHILYLKKDKKAKPVFNTDCRFSAGDRDSQGGSLRYQDLEDIWEINKDYKPGTVKNKNALPFPLMEKMILYSSNPGDVICDFFLGNFTTAYVARGLERIPCGFEINPESFNYHIGIL